MSCDNYPCGELKLGSARFKQSSKLKLTFYSYIVIKNKRKRHLNPVTNHWFINMSPAFKSGLRVFCIPNAGGGPALFRTWSQDLPAAIGVFPILLPGQGSRLRDRVPTQVSELASNLTTAIEPYLDEPFALFGFSMGALIAFELARNLRQSGLPQPLHLFVAARRAPQTSDLSLPLHQTPDSEFIQTIQARYGAIPSAVMQDTEMMSIFTPILRANYTMLETYQYEQQLPFDFPVSAFGGTRDPTTGEGQLKAWEELTSNGFTYHMYEGEHFFIHQHQSKVLEVVANRLTPFINS